MFIPALSIRDHLSALLIRRTTTIYQDTYLNIPVLIHWLGVPSIGIANLSIQSHTVMVLYLSYLGGLVESPIAIGNQSNLIRIVS